MKIIIIIIIIISFVALSGCTVEKQNVNTSPQQTNTSPQQNVNSLSQLDNAKGVAELARKDAIIRFNLPENTVKVDTIIPVEWTDTSLGYPEPGKEPGIDYPLNEIKGYTILIIANGKLYEYHSDYTRIVPPTGPFENLEDIPRIINNSSEGKKWK